MAATQSLSRYLANEPQPAVSDSVGQDATEAREEQLHAAGLEGLVGFTPGPGISAGTERRAAAAAAQCALGSSGRAGAGAAGQHAAEDGRAHLGGRSLRKRKTLCVRKEVGGGAGTQRAGEHAKKSPTFSLPAFLPRTTLHWALLTCNPVLCALCPH